MYYRYAFNQSHTNMLENKTAFTEPVRWLPFGQHPQTLYYTDLIVHKIFTETFVHHI